MSSSIRSASLAPHVDLFRKAVRENGETATLLPAEKLLDQCEQRRESLFGPRGIYDEDVKADGLALLLARIDESLEQIVALMKLYRCGERNPRALFIALLRLVLLLYGDGENGRTAFRSGAHYIYARQRRPENPFKEHLQISKFAIPVADGLPFSTVEMDVEQEWTSIARVLDWHQFTQKK
jgi:hypothetical protein